MQPKLSYFEAKTVVGMRDRFVSVMIPDSTNLDVIPKLWERFNKRADEVKARMDGKKLGVIVMLGEKDLKTHPDEMIYMACVEVKDANVVPKGMLPSTIPAGNYAVFTHKGKLDTLDDTMHHIFEKWLPSSGKTMRTAPHLEIYDERYVADSDRSEFDLAIPID